MSEATENIRLQLKRGEKGSFDIKNCSAVLAYGEPFWDLDNKNLYIGDGETPLSGLDPINVEMFKKVILRLKKNKTMIIFSSHMMEHIEYFCDSLVILVKGSTVLEGKLTKIKEDYRKKNIKVIADLDVNEIKKIKGVEDVIKNKNEYNIKIEDVKYVNDVFKKVSKCNNVIKFVVEEPTLNEIFVSTVGEAYEK